MLIKSVGIILVMFNQKHNLELLYSSIAGTAYPELKIYFVDNNPDEGDSDFSKKLNTSLKLNITYIKPGFNSGFAGGNNSGAEQAMKDGCEYIFFLNNDVVLDKDCISKLVEAIEKDLHKDISKEISIGAAAPLILYGKELNKDTIIQELGAKADFKSYKIEKYFEGKKYSELKNSLPEVMNADVISGGSCLFKSDALEKTGLWEESYFAYGDEIDLAKRVKDSGYKTVAVSSAVLYHNHQWVKDNKKGYYFEYYLSERNKFLYYYKYKLYSSIIFSAIADIIKFPVRLIWFMKVCDFTLGIYYLRGMFAGLLKKKGNPGFSR